MHRLQVHSLPSVFTDFWVQVECRLCMGAMDEFGNVVRPIFNHHLGSHALKSDLESTIAKV